MGPQVCEVGHPPPGSSSSAGGGLRDSSALSLSPVPAGPCKWHRPSRHVPGRRRWGRVKARCYRGGQHLEITSRPRVVRDHGSQLPGCWWISPRWRETLASAGHGEGRRAAAQLGPQLRRREEMETAAGMGQERRGKNERVKDRAIPHPAKRSWQEESI